MPMLPFQVAHYAKVPTWEGKIDWLYLDTHLNPITKQPAPLVTGGIGCAIGMAEALTLPFLINGSLASPGQIAMEYTRVTKMLPGRVASFYQYPGCLTLSEDLIAALVAKRYDGFTQELVHVFPDFLTHWPVPAQTAALDLIWGVGEGGVMKYTHWLAYAHVHNWAECALTCAENPNVLAYTLRNEWRKGLFLSAAAA